MKAGDLMIPSGPGSSGKAAHVEKPVTPGMETEVTITALAFGGQGIARIQGFVIFVWGGLPGDTARVRIDRVRKRHAEATLLEVVRPSSDRVEPACPHFGICGGCRWQSLDYEAQLREKEGQVYECLRRLGGLSTFEMRPIRGMHDPWRYRNKVEFSVGRDADREIVVGFHPAGRWDTVMRIRDCLLLPTPVLEIRAIVERWLREINLEPWDPRARHGTVRHLTVRHATGTGELLAGLTSVAPSLPGLDTLAQRLSLVAGFAGLTHSQVIEARDLPTARRTQQVWGADRLTETLGHLRLEFSLDAFFQTNTHMAEVLYATAAADAGLRRDEVIWDLYCGTGSITLYLAQAARASLGIEVVPAAVENARRNAVANRVTSATFMLGDTRRTLKEILEGQLALPPVLQHPDVVVLDPPRGGLAKKVVARVAAAQPSRVVYVSCNPSTQAGDLALFAEAGYPVRRVTPVDMFPHTPHVETVVLMSRANPSS